MKFIRDDNSERVGLPDITSMIDVVFLLIIFFLTTSSLVQMTRVPLDLPEEKGQSIEENESPGLVINIEADGRIVVDSVEADVARVLSMVGVEIERAGGVDDLDVLLRADRAASLAPVNEIAQGMIDLGVKSWRLATRIPAGGGS